MSLDNDTGELDRLQLLEEIRKRAEAAELARIEAEEAKLSQTFLGDPPPLVSFSPSSNLGTEEPSAENRALLPSDSQNNDVEKTSSSYDEFFPLRSTHTRVEDINGQIADIKQAQAVQHAKHSDQDKAKRNQRVAELLLSANDSYQREHYERALRDLDELIALDSGNSDAALLYGKVEKAKALSDRIREEEQQRRIQEEEAAKQQFVPLPVRKKEEAPPVIEPTVKDNSFVEVKTEVPKTAALQRPKLKRSLIRLAFGSLVLLGIVTTIVVFENIRDKLFPLKINVLVLPPESSTVDAYVAEGLMDDVIRRLFHLRSLNVFSAAAIRGLHDSDVVKLARLYGADYLLRYRVSATGGTLNGEIALIDIALSKRVFGQTQEISATNLAGYCNTTVSSIAKAMDVDAGGLNLAFKSSSANHDAYDAYLLGRYLLNHPEFASLDSVASVFERARQTDPTFAYAEVALGWTHVLLHETSAGASNIYLDEAVENLRRALSLGASSSEVYRLWGATEYFRSNSSQAIYRLEYATTIASSDAEAHRWLALAYLRAGRNSDALAAAHSAAELEPRSHASRSMLGSLCIMNGAPKAALMEFEADIHLRKDSESRSDEYLVALVVNNQHEQALDILKGRIRLHPRDFVAHYDLGRMYQLAGKPKSDWEQALLQALQLIDDTLKVNPKLALAYSYRGLAQTRLGRFADGVKSNKQAIETAPSDIVILYNSARMYALQHNQSSEALEYLAKAIHRRFLLERILDLDLLSLRNTPEFARKIVQ